MIGVARPPRPDVSTINDADLVAIRRAYMRGGRVAALGEMRRRFLGLSDRNAEKALDAVLGRPAEPPPPYRAGGVGKTRG